jgi:hypothetical protein
LDSGNICHWRSQAQASIKIREDFMLIRLKNVFFLTVLSVLSFGMVLKPVFGAEPLKVVATQAMYADIVKASR